MRPEEARTASSGYRHDKTSYRPLLQGRHAEFRGSRLYQVMRVVRPDRPASPRSALRCGLDELSGCGLAARTPASPTAVQVRHVRGRGRPYEHLHGRRSRGSGASYGLRLAVCDDYPQNREHSDDFEIPTSVARLVRYRVRKNGSAWLFDGSQRPMTGILEV